MQMELLAREEEKINEIETMQFLPNLKKGKY